MSLGSCLRGRTLLPLILRAVVPASPFHGVSPRVAASRTCQWIQASSVHSSRQNSAQTNYSQMAVEDISKVVAKPALSKAERQQKAVERFENLTDEETKKMKVLKLEYDVLLYKGAHVPEEMSAHDWSQILDCETASARRRLYTYLLDIEKHAKAKKRRQDKRREEAALQEKDKETSIYNENIKSTIVMFVRKSSMNMFYFSRMAHAMCDGPSLIFDMGFETMMTMREQKILLKQVWISHGMNKQRVEPYHFVFCNFSTKGNFLSLMHASCHDIKLSEFLFTLTEQSYLDLYPKERLVYLTPNARDELDSFDPDDIFIIGGYVDLTNSKPLTLAKAKEEKLRMAKLPLDRYLRWLQGTKSLTIDQMTCILLEWKETRDWKKALRFVPQRKLFEDARNYKPRNHERSLLYEDVSRLP